MDNRSKILDSALKLFSTKGYEAVGVQEIVEISSLTKPTLYHYFGNKQGLLDALLNDNFVKLENQIKNAAQYNNDLPLTITKVVFAFFNFARENSAFYRMQMAMLFAPPESESYKIVLQYNENLLQVIIDLFIKASNDYGNMRGRHQAYAITLQGMINNYIALSLNNDMELNDDLVYRAVHQFQHGIYS